MAIVRIQDTPGPGMEMYDQVQARLDVAGDPPEGLIVHTASPGGKGMIIVDVWESQEAFDEFGKTLMPILQEVGIDPGQPYVEPIHNVIEG